MRLFFLLILKFIFINSLMSQHGTLDESFTGFPSLEVFYGSIKKIKLQPDGKIIGISDRYAGLGSPDFNTILRINQDGEADYSFNPGTGFQGDPSDLDIQNDGKIIVTGFFSSFNGVDIKNIARLNVDGSLDPTFNVDSIIAAAPKIIELQSNGKVIIVGDKIDYDTWTFTPFIKRLNGDGSLDSSFNLELDSIYGISNLVLQVDDKIILWGSFLNTNGSFTENTILRFHPDGSLDSAFSIGTGPDIFPGPSPYINNVALQPDGKLIVTGRFSSFNGVERNGIIRLTNDGSPDLDFDPGEGLSVNQNTCCLINTISFKQNGKTFIGGHENIHYDNYSTGGNFVLNPDGSLDTTYQGININYINSSIILEDGKYLLAGGLNFDLNSPYTRIVRLNNESDITPINSIILDEGILIYPNPFDDYFIIDVQNSQFGSSYYIYNHLSQLVYSNQITNQVTQIDFSSFPSGLYTVLIKKGVSERLEKIVKK